MRNVLMIAAALGFLTVSAPVAQAQKIDANGRCHDKAGKFAKAEVCAGGGAAKSTGAMSGPAADPNGPYKLDAKGKCHDVKGRMAAKAKCAT